MTGSRQDLLQMGIAGAKEIGEVRDVGDGFWRLVFCRAHFYCTIGAVGRRHFTLFLELPADVEQVLALLGE